MIPETSAERGQTNFLRSTTKCLEPGSKNPWGLLLNGGIVQSRPVLVTVGFPAFGDALLSTRVEILNRHSQVYYF